MSPNRTPCVLSVRFRRFHGEPQLPRVGSLVHRGVVWCVWAARVGGNPACTYTVRFLHLAITPTRTTTPTTSTTKGRVVRMGIHLRALLLATKCQYFLGVESRDKHMQCNASCTSLTRRRAAVELQTAAERENPPFLPPSKHFNPQVMVVMVVVRTGQSVSSPHLHRTVRQARPDCGRRSEKSCQSAGKNWGGALSVLNLP